MIAVMVQDTFALDEFEWDVKPAEGFGLGDGITWWGLRVRYRRIGTRRWWRFNLLDVHSWEVDKIHRSIEQHVRLNGTKR